ncbi:MAG: hypothetical protein JNL52_09755 [Flavobacteriales bacterium]|nr:hypothetical protein [Flavobacteriales bacterium]
MPIIIEVLEPVHGKLVEFKVTWTNDLELGPVYMDEIEDGAPRHAIVFFKVREGNGLEKSSETFSTGITQDDTHAIEQTFTALAVLGDQIVAKDRKRVRNARSSMQ